MTVYTFSRAQNMAKWMDAQEAGRQAAAILALEGDEPDEYEQRQRTRLARGEITGDEFLALMVKHVRGRRAAPPNPEAA